MVTKKISVQEGMQLKSTDINNISHALEQTVNDGLLAGLMTGNDAFFDLSACKVVPESGMDVQISTGLGMQYDSSETGTFRAKHKFINVVTAFSQTIAPNSSGSTRYDRISIKHNVDQDDETETRIFRTTATGSLQLTLSAYSSVDSYVLNYTQGTAGSGVPPEIPSGYVSLATIEVPNGVSTILASHITDTRPLFHIRHDATSLVVADYASSGAADYYGADGIQQAIDALPATGGEVLVRTGTYELNRVLEPTANVRLYGQGPSTILKPALGRDLMRIGKPDITVGDKVLVTLATSEQLAIAYNPLDKEYGVLSLDTGTGDIIFQLVDAVTETATGAQVVVASGTGVAGNRLDIVFNPTLIEYCAVWEDSGNDIYARRLYSNGQPRLAAEDISDGSDAYSQPAVCYCGEAGEETYCITWYDDTNDKVMYRSYLTSLSDKVEVATSAASPGQISVDIAYDNNGECRLVYVDRPTTEDRVVAARIDVSGNAVTGSATVVASGTGEDHRGCRVESGGSVSGIVWYEDSNTEVQFRGMTAGDDTFEGAAAVIATVTTEFPEITYDSDNDQFAMVYSNGSSPNGEVHIAVSQGDGTAVVADTTLFNSTTGALHYQAICYDTDVQRPVLIYCDDASIRIEVYDAASTDEAVDRVVVENMFLAGNDTSDEVLINLVNSNKSVIRGCTFEDADAASSAAVVISSDCDGTLLLGNIFESNTTDITDGGNNTVDSANVKL